MTAYALSDQYLQPYDAEHRASVLRQAPEEHGYVCDAGFVTEPPTPFRYFQWRQATYEWAIKAAGIRAFAWHPSEVAPDDIARPGRRIGAMSTPMAA